MSSNNNMAFRLAVHMLANLQFAQFDRIITMTYFNISKFSQFIYLFRVAFFIFCIGFWFCLQTTFAIIEHSINGIAITIDTNRRM